MSNNSWNAWEGGVCPVKYGELVDVQYRDGDTLLGIPAMRWSPGRRDATRYFWVNKGCDKDIVWWRIHGLKEQGYIVDKVTS